MYTDEARQQMVGQQIRTWDVFDADVLRVMADVARDRFVPAELKEAAYADAEIPLAHHQCMLRPSIAGKIIQSLSIRPGDEVLEVGTGTGYLTACLAQLAASVTSVDIFADFVAIAGEALADSDIRNVKLQQMDAMTELPSGRFDAIAVTGSVTKLEDRFVKALKPGGRLFIVVGKSPAMTALLIAADEHGGVTTNELFETDIPALISSEEESSFIF
jgi:protein-L-isoaspartate(D-aspartate) O-methyltransferase